MASLDDHLAELRTVLDGIEAFETDLGEHATTLKNSRDVAEELLRSKGRFGTERRVIALMERAASNVAEAQHVAKRARGHLDEHIAALGSAAGAGYTLKEPERAESNAAPDKARTPVMVSRSGRLGPVAPTDVSISSAITGEEEDDPLQETGDAAEPLGAELDQVERMMSGHHSTVQGPAAITSAVVVARPADVQHEGTEGSSNFLVLAVFLGVLSKWARNLRATKQRSTVGEPPGGTISREEEDA